MGRILVLAAPLIFIAHVLEEREGFVAWFNAHVARGITPDAFWTVNYTGLAITIACVVLWWISREAGEIALFVWLSFLFAGNAVLHIVGALHDRSYVPGLVTAIALYLPYYAWLARHVYRARRLSGVPMMALGVVAAAPMLIHGYLIIFRGSRLF